jgi:hypothetical protein
LLEMFLLNFFAHRRVSINELCAACLL